MGLKVKIKIKENLKLVPDISDFISFVENDIQKDIEKNLKQTNRRRIRELKEILKESKNTSAPDDVDNASLDNQFPSDKDTIKAKKEQYIDYDTINEDQILNAITNNEPLDNPFSLVNVGNITFKVFLEQNPIDTNMLLSVYGLQSTFTEYNDDLVYLLENIDKKHGCQPHLTRTIFEFIQLIKQGLPPTTEEFRRLMNDILYSGDYNAISKTSQRRRKILGVNTPRNILLGGYIESYRIIIII